MDMFTSCGFLMDFFSGAHIAYLYLTKYRLFHMFQKYHYCSVDEIFHVGEDLGPRDILHNQLKSPLFDVITFIPICIIYFE